MHRNLTFYAYFQLLYSHHFLPIVMTMMLGIYFDSHHNFSFRIRERLSIVYWVFLDPLPLPSQELVLTINSFNILICIFRLFKYYEFQDRLNILTRTFGEAWSGLVG